eukprot:gb/GEZN01000859.1/.p1 GENE.gb/GEZN01000859.1/~~gb/GEZN01000859.1/.p1  ORF type:complete len:526 (+),score=64.80 gb/GEZN01000859.1/:52-1578(+)
MSVQLPPWAVGVLLSVGGSVASNVGLHLQKYVHESSHQGQQKRVTPEPGGCPSTPKLSSEANETPAVPGEPLQTLPAGCDPAFLLCDRLWLTGLLLMLVGCVLDWISLALAQMSLLAPLGAISLVVNLCFVLPCSTGTRLRVKQVLAALMTLGGTALCLVYGDKTHREVPLTEWVDRYSRPGFMVYGVFIATSVVLVLYHLKSSNLSSTPSFLSTYGYSLLAGVCGAHTVLYAKCSINIILLTVQGQNQFLHQPFARMVPLLLGCTLMAQLRYLNLGLARSGNQIIVIPVFQASWVLMNFVVGLCYFEDLQDLSENARMFYMAGLLMVLFCMVVLIDERLTSSKASEDSQEHSPHLSGKKKKASRMAGRKARKWGGAGKAGELVTRTPASRPARWGGSGAAGLSPGLPGLEYLGRMSMEGVVRAMAHTRAALAGSAEGEDEYDEGELESIPMTTPLAPLTTCPSPEEVLEMLPPKQAKSKSDEQADEAAVQVRRKPSPIKFHLHAEVG